MPTRNLTDAVPVLQSVAPKILADYQQVYPDRELRVICVLRSSTEQWACFKVGREIQENLDGTYTILSEDDNEIVTKVDGRTKFSKHLPDPIEPKSKAVDFGVFIGGKYMTNDSYYFPLQFLAHKYGLRSGADFLGKFKDFPHVEVPGPIYTPPSTHVTDTGVQS